METVPQIDQYLMEIKVFWLSEGVKYSCIKLWKWYHINKVSESGPVIDSHLVVLSLWLYAFESNTIFMTFGNIRPSVLKCFYYVFIMILKLGRLDTTRTLDTDHGEVGLSHFVTYTETNLFQNDFIINPWRGYWLFLRVNFNFTMFGNVFFNRKSPVFSFRPILTVFKIYAFQNIFSTRFPNLTFPSTNKMCRFFFILSSLNISVYILNIIL